MGRRRKAPTHNANTGFSRAKQKQEIATRLKTKYLSKQPPKKICVVMIVKNESKIIERCLNSHLPVADYVSICDTGSTDNTKDLIRKWCTKHNMPFKIHDDKFKNFSYNRTNSVLLAQKAFPECDYAILPDADMILEVNGDFNKSLLYEDQYSIEQYNKVIRYWNSRIINLKVPWKCVGVTHEFWDLNVPENEKPKYKTKAKIKTLVYDDRADGGCKQDKFIRDQKLLKDGLDDPDEPDNIKTRYKFYLAQTLKDMGEFEESIKYYKLRIKDKGWYEEVYISHYRIGTCYEQLGRKINALSEILSGKATVKFDGPGSILKEGETEEDRDKRLLDDYYKQHNPEGLTAEEAKKMADDFFNRALEAYLESWEFRKVRVEGLYNYVRLCRELSWNREKSLEMALIGKNTEYPHMDALFIEYSVYDYLFDFEISIIASYLPDKKHLGKSSLMLLLDRDDLPQNLMDVTKRNAQFYL